MEDVKIELPKFDAAEFLDSYEAIEAYLEETLSENNPKNLFQAIDTVIRAMKRIKHLNNT